MPSCDAIGAALTVLFIAPFCALGADALVFVGTATNTTNPRQPITSPTRLVFDQDANGVLTISPPLIGSGRCQIAKYDLDSGRVEISCVGAVNIKWTGTIKGSRAVGTYVVEGTPQVGHFEWSLVLPTEGDQSARSNGQAIPPIGPPVSKSGGEMPFVPQGCNAPQLLEKHDGIFPKANLDAALKNSPFKDMRISEILAGGYAEADIIIDSTGRSGERGGGDGATFVQITDPTPRSSVLEQILDSNLGFWKWAPATCSGLRIKAVNPGVIGLNANSQYTVHALAHIRYRFERLTNGDISITTTYTLGNSPACKSLTLIYAPEPRRAILGSTAPFLVCADQGK